MSFFAQKAYEDGKVSFFSVLADHMSKEALESWLDKSMRDRQVSFQSVLLKELDRDWELEALEEELDRQWLAEYEGYGITRDGTVNIKITRGEDGVIQNVDYMTESEVEELFGDN